MQDLASRKRARAIWIGSCLLAIAFVVIAISLNTGSIKIGPVTVVQTLFGYGTPDDELVLFEYRLPRIIITMLAGIGLGISGAILQAISRNALADPGIIGLHAGSSFGLIVFVTLFSSMKGTSALMLPLFTFGGGILATCLIVLLANDRHRGLQPIRLLLVGIAIAAGFSAITLYLSLRLDETTYTFAARWLAGSVWGRDWIHVIALLPWMVLLVPYAWMRAQALNLFSLGDEIAIGVGEAVRRKRLLLLGCAVGLSGASVAMVGGIGFIGLVAPHLARRLVGPRQQYVLPISGLVGLVILVTSDTIGRSIFEPNAIPAGVVVAAVGAPYFLYLLVKTKS
ncbi:FecCD family ABC transporter permease [Brevibacillus sp. FIR094]|uniref:FecCD family ABC transporter permease n=1 Tax=Brevibacillus sp. FIR094 TaxID=3134809 RepID=UPI003D1B4960